MIGHKNITDKDFNGFRNWSVKSRIPGARSFVLVNLTASTSFLFRAITRENAHVHVRASANLYSALVVNFTSRFSFPTV